MFFGGRGGWASTTVALNFGPDFFERAFGSAADEDGVVVLVREDVGVRERGGLLDLVEGLAHAFELFADGYDALAGVVARPPQEIVLVLADCLRESVARAEEVYRARLAVVAREDGAARALFGREAVVD